MNIKILTIQNQKNQKASSLIVLPQEYQLRKVDIFLKEEKVRLLLNKKLIIFLKKGKAKL